MSLSRDLETSVQVPGFRHGGGSDCDLAALRNLLAHRGIVAAHTGAAPTEALLMGLGGGVSLFFTMERVAAGVQAILELRFAERSYRAEFFENACTALGARYSAPEFTAARRARSQLMGHLARGEPVIVFAERAHLPHCTVPIDVPSFGCRRMVAIGYEAETARWLLGDRAAEPFRVADEDLADARRLVHVVQSRLVRVAPPARPRDLKRVVRERLAGTLHAMGPGTTRTSGLAALNTLARALREPKFVRSWHREMATPEALWHGLTGLYEAVELHGGGGGYRKLYADFLVEAAGILDEPRLEGCAGDFRTLARTWTGFARSCLPDSNGPLARSRALLEERQRLFDRRGPDSQAKRERLTAELLAARAAYARAPLAGSAHADFLADLGRRVARLRADETDALFGLAEVVFGDATRAAEMFL